MMELTKGTDIIEEKRILDALITASPAKCARLTRRLVRLKTKKRKK